MSVNPAELWAHAQLLPEATEADRRAKISRSYYALYSHASLFTQSLATQGLETSFGSGMHRKMMERLTNPSVKDDEKCNASRQIGTKQMLAYDFRLKADYYLDEPVTVADVRKCLAYVRGGLAIPLT